MAIDLTQLPAPNVIEELDFETLLQRRKTRLIAAMPADIRAAVTATLALESEPLTILLQENAYTELILRQRINDAARASLLAYAEKTDLDNRAADYGVQRLLIKAANPDTTPPTEAVWEDDERLRYRAQMALEGLSVAGSRGAYLFHTLSASADIADASVDSPTFELAELPADLRQRLPAGAIVLTCNYSAGLDKPLPGDVAVAVLPKPGAEAGPLLERAGQALSAEDVRPLTDRPRLLPGQPQPFIVVATIEPENGPDADVVLSNARQKLDAALAAARRLAGEMPRSAIFAALHVPGVRRVELTQPADDIRCDLRHYPDCRSIELTRTPR
ncbi:baseplate assembly protein [Chromobacterium haemolyticum]|uniref:baseplate assembly protein n=1 Tax=Chromobacterium haemolyticum TaxID=394935 RepID=UPI00307F0FB0